MHSYYKADKFFIVMFWLPQGGTKLIKKVASEQEAMDLVNYLNGGGLKLFLNKWRGFETS